MSVEVNLKVNDVSLVTDGIIKWFTFINSQHHFFSIITTLTGVI